MTTWLFVGTLKMLVTPTKFNTGLHSPATLRTPTKWLVTG